MILTLALALSASATFAKDIKTLKLTTQPVMHCESCETRIKSNIRFEKGVKNIETDIPSQTVTVTYDADKTTPAAIIAGFKKINYDAVEKKDNGAAKAAKPADSHRPSAPKK
jgi:copper chaperone CopZ